MHAIFLINGAVHFRSCISWNFWQFSCRRMLACRCMVDRSILQHKHGTQFLNNPLYCWHYPVVLCSSLYSSMDCCQSKTKFLLLRYHIHQSKNELSWQLYWKWKYFLPQNWPMPSDCPFPRIFSQHLARWGVQLFACSNCYSTGSNHLHMDRTL